jgi:hypothetical protein
MAAASADIAAFCGFDFHDGNTGVNINDMVCMKLDIILLPPHPDLILGLALSVSALTLADQQPTVRAPMHKK